MIKLRKLLLKDIIGMKEWMKNKENILIFQNDFLNLTDIDIKNFILNSFTKSNQHFAIINDEDDEYLGTISLKNIDYKNKHAEYAISSREIVRGTGINEKATELLLKYAFNELELDRVYLNVLSSNIRAIKFYRKCGFVYEGTFIKHMIINNKYVDLEWYAILRNDQ